MSKCSYCGTEVRGRNVCTSYLNGELRIFCNAFHMVMWREEHRPYKHPERKEPKWVGTVLIWLLASVVVVFMAVFFTKVARAQGDFITEGETVELEGAPICKEIADAVAVATAHGEQGENAAGALFIEMFNAKRCASFETARFIVGNLIYENNGISVVEVLGFPTIYYLVSDLIWVPDKRKQT